MASICPRQAVFLMNTLRDKHGRWQRVFRDEDHPWVLIDTVLREQVIRCATRAECREYQRAAGGKIVHVVFDERQTA